MVIKNEQDVQLHGSDANRSARSSNRNRRNRWGAVGILSLELATDKQLMANAITGVARPGRCGIKLKKATAGQLNTSLNCFQTRRLNWC
jgi:hypothetical protein